MKRRCSRILSLMLAAVLLAVLVPETALAGTSKTTTVESTSGADYEKTVYSGSTSVTEENTDGGDVVSTTTKYTLKFTVWTQAASTSDDSLRFVKISKPTLTTQVTVKYTDGTKKVKSTKTAKYSVTLRCYVDGSWKKASKNDTGTGYKYKAPSGSCIEAIQVKPSDAFKSAMKEAGLTFCYQAETEYFGTLGWAKITQTAGTTGNSCALTGLNFDVVTTAEAAALDQTNRYIAKASVQYKTKKTGSSSWSSAKKNGSTSGTKSATASLGTLAVKTLKSSTGYSISGGIQYSVRTTFSDASKYWSDYVSNYSTAGSKNAGIQAIKIKLTGDMADYYDVYYRVYVGNYGWLDWAKNGEKAGTKRIGLTVGAVQIKIVPKGASAPGDTSDHFIDSISGDDELDSLLQAVYKKKGTNLKTLFKYVAFNYSYKRTYDTPSGSWKTWSIKYAKQFLSNGYGNCYRYAAAFCWLARGLGYEAKTVMGTVPSRSQGRAPHGWVEIKINGKTYVCDPELYHVYPSRNWYMQTYSHSTINYKKSS